jgi:hypothetical protein
VLGVSGEWLSPFTHQPPHLTLPPTLQMPYKRLDLLPLGDPVTSASQPASQPLCLPGLCASRWWSVTLTHHTGPPPRSPSTKRKSTPHQPNRGTGGVNKEAAGSDRTCRRHVCVGKGSSRRAGAPSGPVAVSGDTHARPAHCVFFPASRYGGLQEQDEPRCQAVVLPCPLCAPFGWGSSKAEGEARAGQHIAARHREERGGRNHSACESAARAAAPAFRSRAGPRRARLSSPAGIVLPRCPRPRRANFIWVALSSHHQRTTTTTASQPAAFADWYWRGASLSLSLSVF